MNPVQMLKDDHEKVRGLFSQYTAGEGDKASVVRQVLTELEIHSKLEEEIFYPAIQGQGQNFQEVVSEAYREHREVDGLIEELKAMDPGNPDFHTKFRTLMTDVEHHVQEEETEMLPDAERKLGGQADQIAQQMQQRKQQLMQQLGTGMSGMSRTGQGRTT